MTFPPSAVLQRPFSFSLALCLLLALVSISATHASPTATTNYHHYHHHPLPSWVHTITISRPRRCPLPPTTSSLARYTSGIGTTTRRRVPHMSLVDWDSVDIKATLQTGLALYTVVATTVILKESVGLPIQMGWPSQGVDSEGIGRKLWEAPGGIVNYLRGAKGPSGFGSGSTAEDVARRFSDRIRDKVFVITGCTSGLGRELACQVAKYGGTVVMVSRDQGRLQGTARYIKSSINPNAILHTVIMDLSDLDSVNKAINSIHSLCPRGIDVLVNNAGIAANARATNKAGLELQFATNYLGHFALTLGLLGDLRKQARVVNVASLLHRIAYYPEGIRLNDLEGRHKYTGWGAYGQSKLAMILFTEELDKRMKKRGIRNVTVNAVHPGGMNTGITRTFNYWWFQAPVYFLGVLVFGKSIPQGTATHMYAATSPDLEGISGRYLFDCNLSTYYHPSLVENPKLREELWAASVGLTGRRELM